jgi:hypothetical protein
MSYEGKRTNKVKSDFRKNLKVGKWGNKTVSKISILK